jgi:circadian clock protein KaiB
MPTVHEPGGGDSPTTPDAKCVLHLYVAGNTGNSIRAVERAKAFCETHLKGRYELTVIDLYQQPELPEDEPILAVPTLVKRLPPPLRRLIGDLSNAGRLLIALDIEQEDT